MGQPSSGDPTKLYGGRSRRTGVTYLTYLPTCTRIGAPGAAASAKVFTLARSATPRALCHGLSAYLVCPCVDGEEGKMD